MAEKMIQMSRDELRVITKLLGQMTVHQWMKLGMDEYDIQVLNMTYNCLYEEFENV